MIIGCGITAVVIPLYTLARIPFQVFERIGKGLRAARRDSLIGESIRRNDAGRTFGFQKAINVFIFLFMLYGFYSALTDDGSQKAMISNIVSKDLNGTGFGIYHAILGIILFPASLIAGLFYDKVNSNAPFYFGSAIALIATVLMVIFTVLDKKGEYTLPMV
jgi:MFS family permease